MSFAPVADQLAQIRRGAVEVLPEKALADMLKRSRETGTPLTIKLGCDPSRPDLHLGHAVVLRKLRQFQDLGHHAVLIVGDFTAMIGDPSGKSATRPALTHEETRENGRTYFEQAATILDTDSEKLTMAYNSEWLGKMRFDDVIRLAGQLTVARMLEREDFKRRYTEGRPISIHEFLYPLAQGQDSVHLDADVELGGTDQTFNLLVGRALQESAGQSPQVCLTLPLLEGTDGSQKMSKSLDNAIGVMEAPQEMYGKLLSIPDALIYRYAVLAGDVPTGELDRWKTYAEEDPRNAKHDLALRITALYHGEEGAQAAREHFERTVIRDDVPEDIDTLEVPAGEEVGLLNAMREAGLTQSNGEGRRLIEQGAVRIDGDKVEDPYRSLLLSEPVVLKVGKRRYVRLAPKG